MSPLVIDDRLAETPLTYLLCRRNNHQWQPVHEDGALEVVEKVGRRIVQVQERFVCARCTSECRDVWDYPNFSVKVRRMTYAENYLAKHIDGAPRLTKYDAHQAYFSLRAPKLVTV